MKKQLILDSCLRSAKILQVCKLCLSMQNLLDLKGTSSSQKTDPDEQALQLREDS